MNEKMLSFSFFEPDYMLLFMKRAKSQNKKERMSKKKVVIMGHCGDYMKHIEGVVRSECKHVEFFFHILPQAL
jgi:hypothetical protein